MPAEPTRTPVSARIRRLAGVEPGRTVGRKADGGSAPRSGAHGRATRDAGMWEDLRAEERDGCDLAPTHLPPACSVSAAARRSSSASRSPTRSPAVPGIGGDPPRVDRPGVLGRIPGGEDGGRKAPRVAASVEDDGAQVMGCEDTDRVVAIRRAATMRRIAAGPGGPRVAAAQHEDRPHERDLVVDQTLIAKHGEDSREIVRGDRDGEAGCDPSSQRERPSGSRLAFRSRGDRQPGRGDRPRGRAAHPDVGLAAARRRVHPAVPPRLPAPARPRSPGLLVRAGARPARPAMRRAAARRRAVATGERAGWAGQQLRRSGGTAAEPTRGRDRRQSCATATCAAAQSCAAATPRSCMSALR